MRNFLLFVILAATAAAPAVGQIVAPGRSGSGTQRAASVPDFSGIWAHPSFPGFEPLASGPTSLRNRSRQYDPAGGQGGASRLGPTPVVVE
jgi:hypothetical protein